MVTLKTELIIAVLIVSAAVSAPLLAEQVNIFPFVASGGGLNNTLWKSELALKSTSADEVNVLLQIIPRDATNAVASKELTLGPGGETRFADLYAALAAPNGFGTLVVTGDVHAWVRTFNKAAGGATYGQNVPAARVSRYDPGENALFPIHRPASTKTEPRCNLVVLGLSDELQTLTIAAGTKRKEFELQPGVYHQFTDVGAWLGITAGDATLSVRSDGIWAGFVSSIDPYSGDSTMVAGELWLDYVFFDPFDSFTGWGYTGSATDGSSFKTAAGYLSVANYGCTADGCGPVVRKALAAPIDSGSEDFDLEFAIACSTPEAAYLDLEVRLLDAAGTPVLGVDFDFRDNSAYLFAEGVRSKAYSSCCDEPPTNGVYRVRKQAQSYSLHYNEGVAMKTVTRAADKVLQFVEVLFKDTYEGYNSEYNPGGVKLDWVRVSKH